MRTTIGGALNAQALRMFHFHALTNAEQAEAIRKLAAGGQSEHSISHATGLAVEQIRRVLTHSPESAHGQ